MSNQLENDRKKILKNQQTVEELKKRTKKILNQKWIPLGKTNRQKNKILTYIYLDLSKISVFQYRFNFNK